MVFYDFIEIGTSDFDTEIEKNDNKIGISIEPIKHYLDKIPNKQNCIKLNLGISDYNGTCIVNYLSEQTIQKYNFPVWVRGCNSINSYHKTVSNLCKEKNIDIEKISEHDSVDVTTLYTLMNKLGIEGVFFLKIDTEGHDTIILKKFYEEMNNNMNLPHIILFESNVLTSSDDINQIINLYTNIGYDLIERGNDTLLKLNLKKIKNKTKYTQSIKNYYIMDYPLNYSLTNLPHENTLESAMEYCIKYNCSGITLQDGIYQVRNGNYVKYFNGEIYSWIYI
jgi:FkbM family methyltransferase